MAIPASVIPAGNSYSVHVAGPMPATLNAAPESDALAVTAAAAAALLGIHKVDVRQHLTGDDPDTQKYRDFLGRAGAKASAFSPAPAPGVPGEGFWKTTLAVVQASSGFKGDTKASPSGADGAPDNFWWPPRAGKKVEWDCLLVALCDLTKIPGGDPGIPSEQARFPDLWIVATAEENTAAVMEAWIALGAGAVAVIGPSSAAWASRNGSFGNALGLRAFDPSATFGAAAPAGFSFGCFAGGVVGALIEELLGENLFDKSIVRVERDELEARPLHLGKLCATGIAAAGASGRESPERLLQKSGDLAGKVRATLIDERKAAFPQGAPKPWGSKGR